MCVKYFTFLQNMPYHFSGGFKVNFLSFATLLVSNQINYLKDEVFSFSVCDDHQKDNLTRGDLKRCQLRNGIRFFVVVEDEDN